MISIRNCTNSDISWMVKLSHDKRLNYSKAQKQFWKMAKNSDEIQAKWFMELLQKSDVITLASANKKGFIIGKIIAPPAVYSSGQTLMIDDFCVADETLWMTVGKNLLIKIKEIAATKKVKQILVVTGAHDEAKNNFLYKMNLELASNWLVQQIN